jgi:hypothetical protein
MEAQQNNNTADLEKIKYHSRFYRAAAIEWAFMSRSAFLLLKRGRVRGARPINSLITLTKGKKRAAIP